MNQYFENNELLASELRTINYKYQDNSFIFLSDLGVFSKNHIDYGSKLLVETILINKPNCKKILDVGCGYGFIGIVLGKLLNSKVTMIDINQRAVHLSQNNIKENKINGEAFISDIYDNVKESYDLIVTNPPIRSGKETVLKILIDAKNHLLPNGELWFIINKNQGAKSIASNLEKYFKINNVEKSKGFYVFSAKSIDIEGLNC